MNKTHHPINFSPFATNVLEVALGRTLTGIELCTPDGKKVVIEYGNEFSIKIDGKEVHRTDSNLDASYFLNTHEVGYMQ